jgi:hypothetical protein
VDTAGLIFELRREKRKSHSVTAAFVSLVEMLNHYLLVVASYYFSRSVAIKIDDVLLADDANSSLVPPCVCGGGVISLL